MARSAEQISLSGARDYVLSAMELHGDHCHDDPCMFRANVLAYLAHSMGATSADLDALPALLVRYDLECQGCNSPTHTKGK